MKILVLVSVFLTQQYPQTKNEITEKEKIGKTEKLEEIEKTDV